MFFKKFAYRLLTVVPVVIVICIRGAVNLAYDLTIKEMVDKIMYKRREEAYRLFKKNKYKKSEI